MDWTGLFSFAPRAGVARWTGWFIATLILAVLCALALTRVEGAALIATDGLLGLVVAKLISESVRRLHDQGVSATVGIGPGIGIAALVATGAVHWTGYGADAVSLGAAALASAAMAVLMLRPGTPGDDGAPLASESAVRGRAGAVVAVALALAGVAFGFAVLRWQAAVARQSEARTRIAPAPAPVAPVAEDAADQRDPVARRNAALFNRIDALLKPERTR